MIRTRSRPHGSNAELDSKFPGRNETGLESLVKNACDPLRRFSYRLIRDRSIADKLALEMFVQVLRTPQTYLTENEFITFLYRTAIAVARKHTRATHSELTAEAGRWAPSPNETPLPEPAAKIRQFVDELPEQQRNAILLHKYQKNLSSQSVLPVILQTRLERSLPAPT